MRNLGYWSIFLINVEIVCVLNYIEEELIWNFDLENFNNFFGRIVFEEF